MYELQNVLPLFCLFCSYLLVNGAPQFTNCPTSPQCVSVPVTYQCSVDTSGGANSLLWRVLNTSNDSIGTSFFGAGLSPGSLGSIASQFNATLTSTAGPIISNITFIPTLSINNYTVECGAFAIGGGAFTPVIRTCPIVIEGIPAASIPGSIIFTPTDLTFSWSSSSNCTCFSHYSVNVTDGTSFTVFTTTNTNLSLSIPPASFNNTEYSISVAAVDTGGRYMNPQGIKRYIADVPAAVTNFSVVQEYPNDTNATVVDVTVYWNEPPASSRPPVQGYVIYQNITDDQIPLDSSNSSYIIPDATIGSVYAVTVAVTNVLGTGSSLSTTIIIFPITEITSTRSTTETISLSLSGIMSTRSTIIPSPSMSVTTIGGNGCESVSTTVPVAISVSVTFILTATLSSILTLILTLLCVKSRSSKPVEQDKQDCGAAVVVYDEVTTKGQATSPVPLTSNPAYGPITH